MSLEKLQREKYERVIIMLSFGQRLKQLRNEADISQVDLADALGVSAQSVSKWECDAYFPDVSMLLPLATVLGVTTDCLLGAGTNEKDDLEELETELNKIVIDNYFNYEKNLKKYELVKAFLKKYPLNYKVKLDCIANLGTLLYHSKHPNGYSIPSEEFEVLYEEGIQMIQKLIDHDKDPNRLLEVRKHLIIFLTMKEKWDEAETVANEFPDVCGMRKGMLAEIAFQKRDFTKSLDLFREICSKSADDLNHMMSVVASSVSEFGSEGTEGRLEAWRDTKRVAEALAGVFSKYGPDEHFNKVKYLLHAICKISNESLCINDIETALSTLEEGTEVAINAYGEIKSSGASEKLLDSAKKEFRSIPARCYNSVVSDGDNILTREERFKACKARLDSLE